MLGKIRVTPIAAESFGVRSMCTFVETPDIRLLLDAGISLCPNRFGLLPHPTEFRTISRLRKDIAEVADRAEVITVSHYHFDHHTPSFQDWVVNWTEANETARQIYQNKTVLTKNPKEKINASQRHRAWLFRKTGGKHAKKIVFADGKKFTFGKNTHVGFSEPVFHGPKNSMLGWTLMAEIEYDTKKFLFAPDIQGPMCTRTLELIKKAKPEVIMVGGPPFYLSGVKVEEAHLQKAIKNLIEIVQCVPLTILEHHALRDEKWKERTEKVLKVAAETGHSVLTAAEFAGKENAFLEFSRKDLYSQNPPSREFKNWMHKKAGADVSKPPL